MGHEQISNQSKRDTTKNISRRDFLIKGITATAGLTLTSIISKNAFFNNTNPEIQKTGTKTPTNTKASFTETPTSSSTPTPEILRKEYLIEKYGRALTIPAFEYHGDEYSMFDNNYNMDQETFYKQMKWLGDNEYYAVTGPDLIGFLEGSLDLPGRSIILTTDSSNCSQKSIPRMIDVLGETAMHFHSFIWTKDMNENESTRCDGNACWNTFKNAVRSGVFTIGSHTETHRDFGLVEKQVGIDELYYSKKEIEDNLGIDIHSISWPYEVCPYWSEDLYNMGYRYAFGGRSKPLYYCSVEKEDIENWCLPRILPPNINGKSGRPSGETLESIMEKFNISDQDLNSDIT